MGGGAIYDAIIVGGGPAGAAAALALHQRDHRALVIERGTEPQPGPCAGWLSPAAVRLCGEIGISAKSAGGAEFSGLRLCSWDFSQRVDVHESELDGWIVQPVQFASALLAAVEDAGIEVRRGVEPQRSTSARAPPP